MRNATAEGISLSEIAIKYEGLTTDEIDQLSVLQEITHPIESGNLLAKFPIEGLPLFPEKATAVLYLGA